jgi:hypothetical protein
MYETKRGRRRIHLWVDGWAYDRIRDAGLNFSSYLRPIINMIALGLPPATDEDQEVNR